MTCHDQPDSGTAFRNLIGCSAWLIPGMTLLWVVIQIGGAASTNGRLVLNGMLFFIAIVVADKPLDLS